MGMKITPNTALLIAAIIGGLIAIMVIFHPLIGT
jgi:preprotein translocase subunit Sec61beta